MSSIATAPRDEAAEDGLPSPYLLFLGDTVEPGYAKTAFGLRDWVGERCVGEFTLPGARVSTGLPRLAPRQAVAAGARGLVIGVANAGGIIPRTWIAGLVEALEAGLDIISGMHARLADIPELKAAAERTGRRLIDVRTPPKGIPVGAGVRRSGRRILTVGTDCALGKKYAALAITRGLRGRGLDVDFRATGQTGIMIAGAGVPIDAVVSDFVAGAAEMLSPAAPPSHVDVIEGQGSLLHPAYGAVSLGLLQGSQPTAFVVCHEPGRAEILGYAGHAVPSIEAVISATLALGRVTSPDIRCAGISLNTGKLTPRAAQAEIEAVAERLGLPAADPMRGGPAFERLLDACLA
ncbi:DUF1611 domain-containing protein [Caulobacter sp.]|uniref:DUF1611 domain-containing protein n=1 Tax=Caulobacter sp. TaxID=78 RepID=UPI002B45AAC0|nr:DUF1611 domain-containing protein [Caulobacter sp.]HJV41397.1 DUF1611 domain-containing protein [Caulobacter sp.]